MHSLIWNYIAYFLGVTALILVAFRFLSQSARGDREAFARSVQGTARVLKLGNSTPSRVYGTVIIDLLIQVQRPGVEPYELSTMWSIQPGSVSKVQPGQVLAVKVDPLDRNRIFSNESWARNLGVRQDTGAFEG
jgi:hypothetical protein